MTYINMTEYEKASEEVRREYEDQIKKHGRITNMKRTLLNDPPSFKAYMEWYTLKDRLVPIIGERAVSLFSYAISNGNNCMICSLFFRKILVDSGEDPDNPTLSPEEKLLMELGRRIAVDPHNIDENIYEELSERYTDQERTLIIAFAGIMYATNLFNTVAKVELDEVLYAYKPNNK
ncbi:MAG: hypothetical protein PHG90_04680 [Clostridia bacterium]|jgi:hypothetical protein|nr:hypothetical protein [Clostridia bacterium]